MNILQQAILARIMARLQSMGVRALWVIVIAWLLIGAMLMVDAKFRP